MMSGLDSAAVSSSNGNNNSKYGSASFQASMLQRSLISVSDPVGEGTCAKYQAHSLPLESLTEGSSYSYDSGCSVSATEAEWQ